MHRYILLSLAALRASEMREQASAVRRGREARRGRPATVSRDMMLRGRGPLASRTAQL